MRTFLLLFIFATLYTHTKAVDPFAFGNLTSTTGPNQTRDFPALSLSGNSLFVFGGVTGNDTNLWIFDITKSTWSSSDLSFPNVGYSASQQGDTVFIVGGLLDNKPGNNSVISLNMTEKKIINQWNNTGFYYPEYTSTVLYAKSNVSLLLVAFGGFDGVNCTNDLRVLDVKRTDKIWELVNVTDQARPTPRYGASAILNGDEIIIFGGYCDGTPVENGTQVWRFNLANSTWSVDSNKTNDNMTSPDVTKFQITALVDPLTIVAYGGIKAENNQPSNELWTYALDKKNWTRQNITAPNATNGQSGVYQNRRFLLFGGSNSSLIWQLVPEYTCTILSHSCGRCIFAGNCGFCRGKNGTTCVAGDGVMPYLEDTCEFNYTTDLTTCHVNPVNPPWLIPVTITMLILIFVEVVATCVVDHRMTKSQVYIPIQ